MIEMVFIIVFFLLIWHTSRYIQHYHRLTKLERYINKARDMSGQELLAQIRTADVPDDSLQQIFDKLCKELDFQIREAHIEDLSYYVNLQNQINPHFLYNTLDSLRGQALGQGNTEVGKMAEMLAKFYRYCISAKGILVTFRDELENAESYYYIQRYRFGDRIRLVIHTARELSDYYMPKLTLQPIIENAINHGIRKKKGGGTVTVSFMEVDHDIQITISDDGIGMSQQQTDELNELLQQRNRLIPAQKTKQGNGIALYNVNDRIRLYFGDRYGIRIHSTLAKGTDVFLVIPKVDGLLMNKIMEESRNGDGAYGKTD